MKVFNIFNIFFKNNNNNRNNNNINNKNINTKTKIDPYIHISNLINELDIFNIKEINDDKYAELKKIILQYLTDNKNNKEIKYVIDNKKFHNIITLVSKFYYINKDFDNYEKILLIGVDLQDNISMFDLAYFYENNGNYEQMKKYYLMAIEDKENDIAMISLAEYYITIEKDFDNMYKYYLMSCDKGNQDGFYSLISYFKNNQNYEEMYNLFLKYSSLINLDDYKNFNVNLQYFLLKDINNIEIKNYVYNLSKNYNVNILKNKLLTSSANNDVGECSICFNNNNLIILNCFYHTTCMCCNIRLNNACSMCNINP